MLKPEEARQKLDLVSHYKHRLARIKRLQKLPDSAAAVGLGMYGLTADGKELGDWEKTQQLKADSLLSLAKNTDLRKQVLAAAYPTFWQEIERGQTVLERLPFTVGGARRPFRAADRPQKQSERLAQYLEAVNRSIEHIADDALTPEWVAAWSTHFGFGSTLLGLIFAGQIDAGRDDILEILKDCAANRHAIGGPSRQVICGLLCCARPEAWEFVSNLLLAAQRQEGLRQVILETVDESHPDSFRKLLNTIIEEKLTRFPAVARAVSVWLGEELMVENAKELNLALTTIRDLLEGGASLDKALQSQDPREFYRGLWSLAFHDIDQAFSVATQALSASPPERKIGAVKLIVESQLDTAADALFPLLQDSDPRVLVACLAYYQKLLKGHPGWLSPLLRANSNVELPPTLFEALETMLPRLPEKPEPVTSPFLGMPLPNLHRETVADMLPECLQERPAERLLPHLKAMSAYTRAHSLGLLCEPRTLTSQVREVLIACASEMNTWVRSAALKHLGKCTLAEDEARTVEKLLTRKTADLRRGVFEVLLNRSDKAALESVKRLLKGDALQQAGGIEMARRLAEANRVVEETRVALKAYVEAKGAKLAAEDREVIDRVLQPKAAPPSLVNGLGLFAPKDRSPVVPPRDTKVVISSTAATHLLRELDELIHQNRHLTFTYRNYLGQEVEVVLGSSDTHYAIPEYDTAKTLEENLKGLPLKALWSDWYENRAAASRDPDGLELARAMFMKTHEIREGESSDWNPNIRSVDDEDGILLETAVFSVLRPDASVGLRYESIIEDLLKWLLMANPPAGCCDFALDALERAFYLVPDELHAELPRMNAGSHHDEEANEAEPTDWRYLPAMRELGGTVAEFDCLPEWGPAHDIRRYQLARWREAPVPNVPPCHADLRTLLASYSAGGATLTDFQDQLIGVRPAPPSNSYYWVGCFEELRELTHPNYCGLEREAKDIFLAHPALREAVTNITRRVVEVELERGESPSAATLAVSSIRHIEGLDYLFPLMKALGRTGYKVGSRWARVESRPESLTHLISVMIPTADETPEWFAKTAPALLKQAKIGQEMLVALGMVNTRLIRHVAAALGWPGYEEACYWFMAHVPSQHSRVLTSTASEHESKEEKAWRAIVKARSALTPEQRARGVIDVDWFHKAYRSLKSDERWDAIEKAAKFMGYGQGDRKAARLADVLLGRVEKQQLVESIQKRFLKESVHLLGLLPLPTTVKKGDAELADRYKVLKAYERYARGLSSLAKPGAMAAYQLGMENLAVTSGLGDPVRLEWAVSAKETADLAKGPVVVKAKDVNVTLTLEGLAEPELTFTRQGKLLKSLPKELKDNQPIAELVERRKDLKRLVANTRRTLELTMCAGESFRAAELQQLMSHAIVRPFLQRLVLKSESSLGFPGQDGKALVGVDGKSVPLSDHWSIAHPLDFIHAKNWHKFQAESLKAERIQPFKQIFREVYTLAPAEKEDGVKSRRYSGQQVNEAQAKALLSARGWSTQEGIYKLFHAARLGADLALDHQFSTPADAAAPAVGQLAFFRFGEIFPMPLAEVPPVIFSEVMRDLDLVVSVAHVGGVDPEATQSTVAMRYSLAEETCKFLKLKNVKLEGKHALIAGEYGHYSVHLGSGVVHKQPGGSLCVVAVNAQHRGRLFLPFADDDPRTAEVLSKILLLARDQEIQDPTILEQIVSK